VADVQRILRAAPRRPAPNAARPDLRSGGGIDAAITEPWQKLVTAAPHDARWQARRRAINSPAHPPLRLSPGPCPPSPGLGHHAVSALAPFEEGTTTWNGHRVFAIDGSKVTLPKTLQ